MKKISIEVVNRSNKVLHKLEIDENAKPDDLKKAYEKEKRMSRYRQRWEFLTSDGKERVVIQGEKTLASFGIKSGDKLTIKDLGPQISWKGVFLCEYAGPIFIYLLFYLRPSLIYGQGASAKPRSLTCELAMLAWLFHYVKREFETLFVHRFGNDTMPLLNIFKNSSYYWGAAALVAYFVNHPLYTAPPLPLTYLSLALFVVFELSNGYCHIILRNLRSEGTRERKIPKGFLFEYVSCANYTFEVLAWCAFSFATMTLASFGFTALGFFQMYIWAKQKHRRYKKEFDNYPKKRTAIVPFLA